MALSCRAAECAKPLRLSLIRSFDVGITDRSWVATRADGMSGWVVGDGLAIASEKIRKVEGAKVKEKEIFPSPWRASRALSCRAAECAKPLPIVAHPINYAGIKRTAGERRS